MAPYSRASRSCRPRANTRRSPRAGQHLRTTFVTACPQHTHAATNPQALPHRSGAPVADGLFHHHPQLGLDLLLHRVHTLLELAHARADGAVALAEALELAGLARGLAVLDGVDAVIEAPFLRGQRLLFGLQRVRRRPQRVGVAEEGLVADHVLPSVDARPEIRP